MRETGKGKEWNERKGTGIIRTGKYRKKGRWGKKRMRTKGNVGKKGRKGGEVRSQEGKEWGKKTGRDRKRKSWK